MFAVYAKDEDESMGCSHRYQETEFLGIFSTLELAKEQIECHMVSIQERRREDKGWCTPRIWGYYVYSCELDQSIIMNEKQVCFKTES